MAGKKISELQALTEITGQEMIPVAMDGQNYSVLSSLLQSGDATKLNDYMYDVSELMGKMAVRGTKGTAEGVPLGDDSGAYNIDGTIGEPNLAHATRYAKLNYVYYFDISYPSAFQPKPESALLLLFDKDDKILKAIPATEAPIKAYLCFTSEVYKYGVSYSIYSGTSADFTKEYEIRDINDVLSDLSEKSNSMRDDFNNYISDVTDLFGKMVYRDAIGTDLANPIVGSYIRLSDGVLVQANDSYSYQYVDVDSTKCYRLQNLISGSIISMLALYNKDGALIKSYQRKIDGYFVFKGVSKIGLSGTTSSIQQIFTIQSFGISDINTVLNTRQGNRALYVAAGAVYNEQTGFYELNGLTDITEEQMREIYVKTNEMDKYSDLTSSYPGAKIRANLGFYENTYRFLKSISIFDAFRDSQFEVLKLGDNSLNYRTPVSNVNSAFTACRKLTKIIGVLDFSNITSNVNYTFRSCEKLNSVFIKNLKISIPFSDSPLLSLESLQYLITNAANTSAIMVTVHADVYAKIQDESQADWHALITSAQEKQITFATA